MSTDPLSPPELDVVVDLGPLSAACRVLVGWYDQFLAGDHPRIEELDRIITTFQALPPVPGRIGRDIRLIVTGGRNSTRGEIIGAVERRRTVSNHSPAPADTAIAGDTPRRKLRSRRRISGGAGHQDPLPGFTDLDH